MTSSKVKCSIYILIAGLTALSTDMASYQSFNDIFTVKGGCMVINVILQMLIALRAYLDQSITTEKKETTDVQV